MTKLNKVKTKAEIKLEDAKKLKFQDVIIIGLNEENHLSVETTYDNIVMLHYIMNRALFELNVFEANRRSEQK